MAAVVARALEVSGIDLWSFDTDIGPVVAAVSDRGLTMAGIAAEIATPDEMISETTAELSRRHRGAVLNRLDGAGGARRHRDVVAALRAVASGTEPEVLPELRLVGTAFQLRVWEALRRIGRGQVVSYREVAAAIGAPRSVRATAGAVGANPVGLIVPCHRVIRSDGTIGGFGWGIGTKRRLLAAEGVHLGDDPGSVR